MSRVRFDKYGQRFCTAAADGTVSLWSLEEGGRSNARALETQHCFGRQASDALFVGGGGSVVAAAGLSPSGANIVVWDSLAPPASSRLAATCHEGGRKREGRACGCRGS